MKRLAPRGRTDSSPWAAASPAAAHLDYLTLDLGDASEGTYRMMVVVSDRVTGYTASLEREFAVVP